MYIHVQYPPRSCIQCGETFTPRNRNSTCCSVQCRLRHRERTREKRVRAPREPFRGPFTCGCCSRQYKTSRPKGEGEKYCSRECAFEARKAKPTAKPAAECRQCGCSFTSAHGAAFCSDVCRKKSAAAKSREYSSAKKVVLQRCCRQCGKEFFPEYGNKRSVFCSEQCSDEAQKAVSLAPLKTKAARIEHRRKRERRLRGRSIDRNSVFLRDGWICQICGIPVNRDARVPEHDAPTIDHRIPLMHGGVHDESNCQCAHFICNVRKAGKLAPHDGDAEGGGAPIKSLQG